MVASSVFGVFDGHSGASCSDFVSVNLDKAIYDSIRQRSARDQSGKEIACEVLMKTAFTAAFRSTEHNFFQYANKLDGASASAWSTAGSTACVACLFGPDEESRLRLLIANAGDSRVVLAKRNGRAVRLSEDHTPDLPAERKRIEQQGASVVNASGIWRIVLPSRRGTGMAGLSVARGFGDLEYKMPAPIVSPVPDVTVMTVNPYEDSFIILASDGVWGPVEDEEACRIVTNVLRGGAAGTGERAMQAAAQQLAEIAHQREPHDDKTVVVVCFGELPEAQADRSVNSGVKLAPQAILRSRSKHGSGGDDMFGM